MEVKMKKLLVVLIFLFCNLSMFAQVENPSKLSNDNELYINISAIGFGIKVAPNDVMWINPYRLFNINYVVDRQFGFEFSPFEGWLEYTSFTNSEFFNNTISFFNFRFSYYFFMDYINDTVGNLMVGPYISINYLNMDNITGFGMSKMGLNIGLDITIFRHIENTPITIASEFNIGYKFTNYLDNKHSFYFTLKYDPLLFFVLFAEMMKNKSDY
jgi:hypothetical protein